MHDEFHGDFYPLHRRHVDLYVPAAPGAFALALRLASGAHHTFYAAESDDLQETLRCLSRGELSAFPPYLRECLERFRCYLSYEVFAPPAHGPEVEKMLRQTNDPIARLRVLCAN